MKAPKLVLGLLAGIVSFTAFSQDSTKTMPQQSATGTQMNTQSHDSTAVQSTNNSIGTATTSSTATPFNPLQNQWNWEKSHNGTQAVEQPQAMAQPVSAASNFPAPNSGRHYIPALGTYKAADQGAAIQQVTLTVDDQNPGKVWVEGLMPARFYAILKAVPGTYKIPAQKADDKNIPEGTLMYDNNSKQLTACVGCGYNDATPMVGSDAMPAEMVNGAVAAGDAKVKTEAGKMKTKNGKVVKAKVKREPVVTFTGTKVDAGTASTQPVQQ